MKKQFLVLAVALIYLILLSGCNNFNIHNPKITTEDTEMNTVKITQTENYTYMEGKYSDRVWDKALIEEHNSKPTSPDKTVSDADAAIQIATIEFEKFQREGRGKSYCLSGVFYDTEDQVWIVWFSEKQVSNSVYVAGACYNVAIAKNSGQVIKVWASE